MRRAVCALALLTLAACGSGGGDDSAPATAPPLAPTLASIQANVFSPTCAISGCHSGPTPPQGLRLENGQSLANLVNQPSPYGMMLVRVVPGDPDASFLIQKLEVKPPLGERMPANGPPYLPPATIAVIRDWIENGALP